MPLYDFTCTDCSRTFEDLVAFEAPAPACPDCGGVSERAMSLSFATPGVGRVRTDWSKVPFDKPSGGCCGGACAGHRH